jgi:DNA-binding transcriptional LysR family regulator
MEADLHCLETFVILADCGSFSDTAAAQSISQPAVSQRIAKLESLTGLRLFHRSQESLTPTHEGRELLGIARRIVSEHERLGIRMGHHLREIKGVVRVMLDDSFAGTALESAMGDGSIDVVHPGACRPWVEALDIHQVDLVVTGAVLPPGQIDTLRQVELERQGGTTLAWNPVYFDFDPKHFKIAEILRSTILAPGERLIPGYLPLLERWCAETHGLLPPDLISFDDEASAREACLAGLGVLVFPGEAEIRMRLRDAGLGIVRTSGLPAPDAFHYSIYLRKDEASAKVLAAVEKIAEAHRRAA